MKHLFHLSADESGQSLTEYLILLILISVISITAVRTLGSTIQEKLQKARERINGVSINS